MPHTAKKFATPSTLEVEAPRFSWEPLTRGDRAAEAGSVCSLP